MTYDALSGRKRSVLVAVLVLCLPSESTVRAFAGAAVSHGSLSKNPETSELPRPRYLVSADHYLNAKETPKPLNHLLHFAYFVRDGNEQWEGVGKERVVDPQASRKPKCTKEQPCEEVWFQETSCERTRGVQMSVWLQPRNAGADEPVWLAGGPGSDPVCFPIKEGKDLEAGKEWARAHLIEESVVCMLLSYDKRKFPHRDRPGPSDAGGNHIVAGAGQRQF